jgi:hypothetical protein
MQLPERAKKQVKGKRMHRAPLGNVTYWDSRVKKFTERIGADKSNMGFKSKNPGSEPQYWFNHARYSFRLIMMRYSRGDTIDALLQHSFVDLLDSWEHSNLRAFELVEAGGPQHSREWRFTLDDLNFYNWCFWVAGLALLLEVPDEQWQRLHVLISHGGQDRLLDRIMATRQLARKIGTAVLHPKPYARLLRAIEAPRSEQPALLLDFVRHWYPELQRKPGAEVWWHVYGDPVRHPLEKGSYFGRWCIEAAVATKVFELDDSLCLAEEHYPAALLHPESTYFTTFKEESIFSKLKRMVLPG